MSVIRRLFRSYPRPARRPEPVLPAPLPDECLLAVGDIHGRLDLLDRLLAFRKTHFPLSRLIVLGDMIDRGPHSAGVLDRLQSEDPANAVCILGNHEQMLLDALDDPARLALSWLRAGGLETATPDRPLSCCSIKAPRKPLLSAPTTGTKGLPAVL